MREQLIQYVELLFAGAKGCEDIKQEILQNTLDRYDDLIAEGKVPEAAYRLAITGIGDISEILGTAAPKANPSARTIAEETAASDSETKRRMRAIAVGLYIVCILPLIALSELGMDIIGLCITVTIVAVATVIMILAAKKDDEDGDDPDALNAVPDSPKQALRKSINSLIWVLGLTAYFILSFLTGAWFITWLVFPITGAVKALAGAILDLWEAVNHEN